MASAYHITLITFFVAWGTPAFGLQCGVGQFLACRDIRVAGKCSVANDADVVCLDCRWGDDCSATRNRSADPSGWIASFVCPAGYYCPNPQEAPKICPAGYQCPKGSFSFAALPAMECTTPGLYCAEGTEDEELCPPGYYCPTPHSKVICPSGYYCVEGSSQPRQCTMLTLCSEGSKNPSMGFVGILAVVALLVLRLVLTSVYFLKKRTSQEQYGDIQQEGSPKHKSSSPAASFDVEGQGNSNGGGREGGFHIIFENMTVTLNDGKSILADVSGMFRPGRMCAVMGPSGAGKSTLLTALLGLNTANVSGNLTVNGQPATLKQFKTNVGFVPQDDICLCELTVTNNLYFSAAWRLPTEVLDDHRRDIINGVLNTLQLPHVKDSIVGDAEHRGISGGQRKRVNIGLELVAQPSVLFLDEPTSGLDSTSSLDILGSLKHMAVNTNLTIAAVIHQPRMRIFTMFDDVLFLAKGGRTVYMGSTERVVEYFNSIGYEIPNEENPADFFMDVIAGEVLPTSGVQPNLVELWKKNQHAWVDIGKAADEAKAAGAPNARQLKPIWVQSAIMMKRTVNSFLARPSDFVVDLILTILGAVGTGFVFGPNGTWDYKRLDNVILFSMLILGLITTMASLQVFGDERLFFFREQSSGLSIMGYFFAKNVIMVIDIFWRPLIYAAIFYNFVQFYMTFTYFYLTCVAVVYSCSGLGYLISIIVHPRNSLLAAVVIPFILGGMFSGLLPSVTSIKESPGREFISYFSFGRWSMEVLVFEEYRAYPESLKENFMKPWYLEKGYDFNIPFRNWAIIVLMMQGVLFRSLGFIFMLMDRHRIFDLVRDRLKEGVDGIVAAVKNLRQPKESHSSYTEPFLEKH